MRSRWRPPPAACAFSRATPGLQRRLLELFDERAQLVDIQVEAAHGPVELDHDERTFDDDPRLAGALLHGALDATDPAAEAPEAAAEHARTAHERTHFHAAAAKLAAMDATSTSAS